MLTNTSGQNEHHSMVGSVKDPDNPKGVAASIFAAVAVYAVRLLPALRPPGEIISALELLYTGSQMLMGFRCSLFSAASKPIYMYEQAKGEL